MAVPFGTYGESEMQMKKTKMVAMVVVTSLSLSGCITTSQPPAEMSPTEMAMRQKATENKRMVQGVVTGAVVGAVVGGGLALLMGGDERAMARGAGLGALAGGTMGGMDAHRVNKEAGAEISKQDELKAIIAEADKNIAHYKQLASQTGKLAAERNKQIADLNSNYSSGELDAEGYRSNMRGSTDIVRVVNGEISEVDRDISDLEGIAKGGKKVGPQIAGLKQQKASLEKQRDALVLAFSRVPKEIGVSVSG